MFLYNVISNKINTIYTDLRVQLHLRFTHLLPLCELIIEQ